MSMCTILNRASGAAKVDMGVVICRWIFECWHLTQVLAHRRTSLLMPGQTYLVITRCSVAQMPGYESEQRWSATPRRNWGGTTDCKVPVNVSQVSKFAEPGREMSLSFNVLGVVFSFSSCGTSC